MLKFGIQVREIGLWCLPPLSTIFTWRRKPGNRRKATTLSHTVVWVHLAWSAFDLTTLVVIGNDYICRCKSNSHTIMTTTAPVFKIKLIVYMYVWNIIKGYYIIFSYRSALTSYLLIIYKDNCCACSGRTVAFFKGAIEDHQKQKLRRIES